MENKKIKLTLIVLISILLSIAIYILVADPLALFVIKDDEPKVSAATTPQVIDDDEALITKLWDENSKISDDYIGTITFESGLINLPFVQGDNNDTYYRKDWISKEYSEEGSVYLDSSNSLDDQNLILIGHYVYPTIDPSGTRMFTPLAQLIDEENYEENKYVKLYLHNELRRYEIAYVYYCELIEDEYKGEKFFYTDNGFEFYYPNYTEEQFNTYLSTIKEKSFYQTGVDLTFADKLLTLQTCVLNHPELREIVILKEINRTLY